MMDAEEAKEWQQETHLVRKCAACEANHGRMIFYPLPAGKMLDGYTHYTLCFDAGRIVFMSKTEPQMWAK